MVSIHVDDQGGEWGRLSIWAGLVPVQHVRLSQEKQKAKLAPFGYKLATGTLEKID